MDFTTLEKIVVMNAISSNNSGNRAEMGVDRFYFFGMNDAYVHVLYLIERLKYNDYFKAFTEEEKTLYFVKNNVHQSRWNDNQYINMRFYDYLLTLEKDEAIKMVLDYLIKSYRIGKD